MERSALPSFTFTYLDIYSSIVESGADLLIVFFLRFCFAVYRIRLHYLSVAVAVLKFLPLKVLQYLTQVTPEAAICLLDMFSQVHNIIVPIDLVPTVRAPITKIIIVR